MSPRSPQYITGAPAALDTAQPSPGQRSRFWESNSSRFKVQDWIIDYVPPSILVNTRSAIEKLKNHIRKLYQQSPDFTPVEKKAAKGYFKAFTIPGNEYKDPKLYLTDVTHTTTRLIESNLNKGTKVKVALHSEMVRVDPDTKEDVYTTCYLNSNLKTIIQKDIIDEGV